MARFRIFWYGMGMLFLWGCQKTPPWEDLPPEGYRLQRNVILVDSTIFVGEDSGTVIVVGGRGTDLKSGDVIITPRSARKIHAMQTLGDTVVLYTQPATLEEVFAYANLEWSDTVRFPVTLLQTQLQSAPRTARTETDTVLMGYPAKIWVHVVQQPIMWKEDTLGYTTEISIPLIFEAGVKLRLGDTTGNAGVGAEVRFSGQGELRPSFLIEISLRVGMNGLEYLYGAVGMGESFTLTLEPEVLIGTDVEFELDTISKILEQKLEQVLAAFRTNVGPIVVGAIGPIPITFSVEIQPYAEMNFTAGTHGGVRTTFVLSHAYHAKVGAVYIDGQVYPVSDIAHPPLSVYIAPPQYTLEGEMGFEQTIGLRLEPGISLAEVVGIAPSVKGGLRGEESLGIQLQPAPPSVTGSFRFGPTVSASVVLKIVRMLRFEAEVWSGMFIPLFEHTVTYQGSCKTGDPSWYGGVSCGL